MNHNDYTKNILNIKDPNIHFNENCLSTTKIKGVETKIFHGTLSYTPTHCPKCNCLYEKNPDTIIKYGFKKNCNIKLPKISNYTCRLLLDKQRFFCKHCKETFIATTDLVDFHKQISNNTVLSITLDLMKKSSETDIAQRHGVSVGRVNNILDTISKDTLVKHNGKLPEAFGIDEFKATKDTKSKMAFIIVDHDKKNIFDINNSRLSKDINDYFKLYSLKERKKVKFITMDLYKPYYILMEKLFKNAVLIADRFHVSLQIRNALDKTRIKLCYKSNPNYNKLKYYWKLILKKKDYLDDKNKKYSRFFKKYITQKEIVTYLINTDIQLKQTYNLYQGILKSIDSRDKSTFTKIIHNVDKDISKYAKKAIKTFLDMEKYILNAFDYEYSNGIVEGTNNVIKQLKHTACGYRKFSHLKARVMLVKGLYNPVKI